MFDTSKATHHRCDFARKDGRQCNGTAREMVHVFHARGFCDDNGIVQDYHGSDYEENGVMRIGTGPSWFDVCPVHNMPPYVSGQVSALSLPTREKVRR